MNSQSYLSLLNETLLPEIRRRNDDEDVYFQQDGTPPHYALAVRDWLDENFPGRWIGRRGPLEWPPRSPDLTPPDFFLWGVVKDIVYANKPRSVVDLKQEIRAAVGGIPLELCAKVCRSVPARLQKCLDVGGAQTELF